MLAARIFAVAVRVHRVHAQNILGVRLEVANKRVICLKLKIAL